MNIVFNGSNVELKFGMGFVRELNELDGLWTQNVNMGMALQKVLPAVVAGDPVSVSDVVYCATYYLKLGRPSRNQVDEFLENTPDFEAFIDELVDSLKESNLTKVPLLKIMSQMNLEEEALQAKEQLQNSNTEK